MALASLVVGLVVLTVFVSSVVLVAHRFTSRELRLGPAPHLLATVIAALALGLLEAQCAGTAQVLNSTSLLVLATVNAALGLKLKVPPRVCSTGETKAAPSPALALIVGASVLLLAATWATKIYGAEVAGISEFDSLFYHLPQAALIAQTGSTTLFRPVYAVPLTAWYPANSELVHAIGIITTHRDSLSPLFNIGWLVLLIGASVILVGGKYRLLGITAVVGCTSGPLLVLTQAGTAKNDVAATALIMAALALLRFQEQDPRVTFWVGLAAGLATATRPTIILPSLVLVGVAILRAHERRRSQAVRLGLGFAITAPYWYILNLIRTGNPEPSIGLNLGPIHVPVIHNPGYDNISFAISHYLLHPGISRAFLQASAEAAFGRPWIVVIGIAVVGLILGTVGDSFDAAVLGVGVAALVGYVVSPLSAAGPPGHPSLGYFYQTERLLLPTLMCGWTLAARFALRWRAGPIVLGLTGVAVQLATFRALFSSYRPVGCALAGAAFVIAVIYIAPGRLHRSSALVGCPLLLLVVVLVAVGVNSSGRYRVTAASSPIQRVWEFFQNIHDTTVAERSFQESYPLTGSTVSNRVRFIGLPHDYSYLPSPSCDAWRTVLGAQRLDWLVIGPNEFDTAIGPEASWTDSIVGPPRRQFGPFRIYSVTKPLGLCPAES